MSEAEPKLIDAHYEGIPYEDLIKTQVGFGKWSEKTYAELLEDHSQYIDWMEKTVNKGGASPTLKKALSICTWLKDAQAGLKGADSNVTAPPTEPKAKGPETMHFLWVSSAIKRGLAFTFNDSDNLIWETLVKTYKKELRDRHLVIRENAPNDFEIVAVTEREYFENSKGKFEWQK